MLDKTDFGSYGVVGGMAVIVMLAYTMRLVRGGIAAVMTQAPQKWYNMRYIDMSGSLPMRRRVENAKVRYSAAYPTRRERMLRRETKTTVAIYCGNQV